MTPHALEPLLAPIGEESPTGEDLEYDQAFLALDRAAVAKPERVVGDSVKAAEEPDWDSVATQAEALLGRSKDLRVAVHLATAWMRIDGWPGWSDGLGLIRALLENFWDGVYPQLDAEDDNDPTSRVNAVMPISDPQSVLGYLRTTAFVRSPRLGRFSLRDVNIADGTLKISAGGDGSGELPTLAEIEACCMDCAEEELVAVAGAVDLALEHARAIDGLFTEKVGAAGPDLKPLLIEIQALKKFLDPQLARRLPAAAGADTEAAGEEGGTAVAAGVAATTGRINGPQDVSRRIDELCQYYEKNEPSSPVPLLLRRAQRLVGKNFLDLLGELAPSGVSEMKVISGAPDQE